MRRGQVEPFAQEIRKMRARFDALGHRNAVDGKSDRLHGAVACA
jgi:hypothetical protein